MNWLRWSTPPADVEIEFDDETRRDSVSVPMTDSSSTSDFPGKTKRERLLLYRDGETVSGKVSDQ
jgi:hypothetical protein